MILILMLVGAILLSFVWPLKKGRGSEPFINLNIPMTLSGWNGRDVSSTFLDLEDQKYNFIDAIYAAEFMNASGKVLTLSVTQAAHFHNPRVCYEGEGYDLREISPEGLYFGGKPLPLKGIEARKGGEGFLTIYWLCLDGKVMGWRDQLTHLLWNSLNHDKTGSLMIRIDLPIQTEAVPEALSLIRGFLEELNANLSQTSRECIFGK